MLVCGALLVCAGSASASTFRWSGPLAQDTAGVGPGLDTIACGSASSCTALTTSGGAVTFDPASPRSSAPAAADSGAPLDVTCPTSTECVAVDIAGSATTFDPAHPASATAATIDPSHILTSVACPQSSSCVAVDTAGREITFTPGVAAASAVTASGTIDSTSGAYLTAVSCFAPPSATQPDCVAVDDAGLESTFNSTTGRSSGQSTIDYNTSGGNGSNALTALACPSASMCLAFDGNGAQIEFDPSSFTGTTRTILDAGYSILSATCVSTSLCTVIDSGGGEVSFAPLAKGTRVVIASTKSLSQVACPRADLCVAVDGQGQAIGYDPVTGSAGPGSLVDAAGSYAAVGCASISQCSAADSAGNVVTFDPAGGAVRAEGAADAGAAGVYGVACPATGQCTLVDHNGTEVTFEPAAPATRTSKQLVANHPLLVVACPSATQCTTADDAGQEITFDPQNPGAATYAPLGTPSEVSVTGLACPSATQCTAVDGVGEAITFNPQSPGRPTPHAVLATGAASVACPSMSECVAISTDGERATFSPASPSAASTAGIDTSQPGLLACPTATACLEVDAEQRAVEFDPHGAGAAAVDPAFSPATVTGLTCASSTLCVAVDTAGFAYAARGTLPPAPAATAPLRIRGTAMQGDRLTLAGAAWSPAPTAVLIAWQRCSARGTGCRPIAGATTSVHRLSTADVGHRLRAVETASDPGGTSRPLASRLSATVSGRPAAPSLHAASLTLRAGRALLRVTIRAARFGPLLRQVRLTLPAGVRDGRARAVTIQLRRAGRTLRVSLASPRLELTAALRRRLAAHLLTRLTLGVAVPAPGRRSPHLHTTITFRSKG